MKRAERPYPGVDRIKSYLHNSNSNVKIQKTE